MDRTLSPTRRGVLAGLAALPVLAPGIAQADIGDHAARLARALRGIDLPYRPATLDLLRYGDDLREGDVIMEAVIKLTWPPGYRTRKLTVVARDYDAALEAMVHEARETFAPASNLT